MSEARKVSWKNVLHAADRSLEAVDAKGKGVITHEECMQSILFLALQLNTHEQLCREEEFRAQHTPVLCDPDRDEAMFPLY